MHTWKEACSNTAAGEGWALLEGTNVTPLLKRLDDGSTEPRG